jgi:uncharacterized membrane protein YjjP (DUF1212 family)
VQKLLRSAFGVPIGQRLRSWLSYRRLNQYGVAALSAVTASGMYVLTMLMLYLGLRGPHYSAAIIASVLFLFPGFPLIAGLFDLMQHQTVVAVSRLAHGVMVLLAVALGLSVVIEIVGIDVSRQPPLELAHPLKLLLRAMASFLAASAFAMLFNCPRRTVLATGLLALVANDLRLVLIDLGMMPASAAFFAALAIGLVALLVDERFNAAFGDDGGTDRHHDTWHLCVRDDRLVQPRANARCAASIRNVLVRCCRAGSGLGDTLFFSPRQRT